MTGKEIRRAREFYGLAQWKVAREAGIRPEYLTKIELGYIPLTSQKRAAILSAIKKLGRGNE